MLPMKYVIIIPDGAADHPLDELAGQTAFETANKPHTDALCKEGRQGTVATTPKGFACGSDVCSLCLLGYDPAKYHKGRAPLEAAAMGLDLHPSDWIFRVNFVTVLDGLMQDHSAGAISNTEARELLKALTDCANLPDLKIHHGVSYRNIMVDTSGRAEDGNGRDWAGLKTTPPHDVPGEPIRKYLPKGTTHAKLLKKLISQSEACFAEHEINQTRCDLGESPATHVWPWGQGQTPSLPSFESRFGLKGAMITGVDLLAGIAHFMGWDRLNVPGQTSYHASENYAAAGEHAIAALDDYDIVCVHIEAPDEASHQADAASKVAAIEAMDKSIVGPIHRALKAREKADGGFRLLYMPDHYTAVGTRKHDPTPPPFILSGTQIRAVRELPFNEKNAAASDLHIQFGHELMEYFLFSGLK